MLVTALDFNLPDVGQTASIVYIPEGQHSIRPTVNGKPKTVSIKMDAVSGEKVAASFQEALEKRLSANVRPTFDFDHKDIGPASALPKRFFYEKGKGLMTEIEWTGAGRSAIESKDYSYFSPTFLLGDDGIPAGIPERGPLGALVNEPAFRDIPRIAASQIAEPDEPVKPTTMSKLIFAALAVDAAHADAESLAVQHIEKIKTENTTIKASLAVVEKERDDSKTKLEAALAEVTKSKETAADNLIKAAIADGRIAAKDEGTKTFWKDLVVEKGESAVKALDALPKQHEGIEEEKVTASGEKLGEGSSLLDEAKKLVAAKEAPNEQEAMSIIAARNPEAYDAYTASLTS